MSAQQPENSTNSSTTTTSSLYPPIQKQELAENLFPDTDNNTPSTGDGNNTSTFESSEEIIVKIPGTVLHLIDKDHSFPLATGDFTIIRLLQGVNVVALLARVGEEIQWPLAKDEAAVKLDESHYFFTLRVPDDETQGGNDEVGVDNLLNYGLTIAAKGQEALLEKLDEVLGEFTAFRVEKVAEDMGGGWWNSGKDVSPEEMEGRRKELMEKSSEAYWTTLAPNVEDYSSWVARAIATGSGHVVRGILWGGDVTVERLKWGDEYLKRRMWKGKSSEMSPQALRKIKRGSRWRCEDKVCDAVEVAGKNVMSTTAVVTTALISQRHGEPAGKVTKEGLDAAGHAIGTAWAVFKISKAVNPKNVMKPSTIAKAAAKATLQEKQKTKDSPTSLP